MKTEQIERQTVAAAFAGVHKRETVRSTEDIAECTSIRTTVTCGGYKSFGILKERKNISEIFREESNRVE